MYKVLLCDSYEQTSDNLAAVLSERCNVSTVIDEKDFVGATEKSQYDLVFLDVDSLTDPSMQVLKTMISKNPYLPIIITSKSEKAEVIVQAMNCGASDFLVHPISTVRANVAVDKTLEIRDSRFEIAYHRHKQDVVYNFKDVIAESQEMKKILKSLERFSQTDSTILITGDTGTGKSFLSGTVHFNSPRRRKPFVKINCANIPKDLLESELFGHEKGAFTGADKQRIGRFEQAAGGTIFLDEIGEMDIGLQTKLLRVIEEKSFERVGGNKTIYSDVRIIAATNKNLVQQVEDGEFREDLYYRINVLPVRLPSLRERPNCLLPLANLLLKKCCKSMRRDIVGFNDEARMTIQSYGWPGNIRQLANTIERAVILEDTTVIHAANLSLPDVEGEVHKQPVVQEAPPVPEVPVNDAVSLADQERNLILKVLEECLWVQKNAAKKLGISPRSLNYKIQKLKITHPHWRKNS